MHEPMEQEVVAVVRDTHASWEQYRQPTRHADGPPRGLLIHVAGPTDEGIREIEVWRSHAELERYERERAEWAPSAPLVSPIVRSLNVRRLLHPSKEEDA